MTTDLRTFSVDARPHFILCLQKNQVNMLIAEGHFNLTSGVCVGIYGLTYSFHYPPWVIKLIRENLVVKSIISQY